MLSDKEIIVELRHGNSQVFRQYFYEYCMVGYLLFDKKYELSKKENLDFMSLAHQYALYLMEHDWKPLEDRSPEVSLRTWMINGFRYIVLDALKWYKREYGSLTFQDYLMSFDTSQDLRLNFNKIVFELCDSANLDQKSRSIILMLLVDGYKSKEVAEQMGITPAAVSQRYKSLKESYIIPYFRKNFDMDFDMPEVMAWDEDLAYASALDSYCQIPPASPRISSIHLEKQERYVFPQKKKRTTRSFIQRLSPGEIFVFGSNLRGIHNGGAAYCAYRRFGAVMGQGVGLQGRSYAIPTMQGGVETIQPYVDDFIEFAKEHKDMTFLVTRIGCGMAGFDDEDMAPLFEYSHEINNIILPEGW